MSYSTPAPPPYTARASASLPERFPSIPDEQKLVGSPHGAFNGLDALVGDHVYIAVMGVTGAGKSKFIAACSGCPVEIGHSLESCTTEVDDYTFQYRDKIVHLVDTPGFDDTYKSDREVLEGIATWLGNAYTQRIKLTGLLYLHRITDVRLAGAGRRNLVMFKKLCGGDFYPRVFLVTTRWDEVSDADGEARERELIHKHEFWGEIVKGGAAVKRHRGTRDSAIAILDYVVHRNRGKDGPRVLTVQKELVDERRNLDQTSAGQEFEVELRKQREIHEREIRRLQQDVKELMEMNELKAAQEAEKERKKLQQRIDQSYEDQKKLKTSLDELMQWRSEELARLQRKAEEDAADLNELKEQLRRVQSIQSQTDPNSPQGQALAAEAQQDQIKIQKAENRLNGHLRELGRKTKRYCANSAQWFKDHPELLKNVAIGSFEVLGLVAAVAGSVFGVGTGGAGL